MLFRVIISPQNIQKVRLDPVPDSVNGLKLELKSKLQLKDSFDLQYEDEDFHDFCNLTCVADLPKDKVTLKVLFTFPDTLSDSSLDTTILGESSSPSTSSPSIHSELSAARSQPWPTTFPIPVFTYDVELRLRQGNEAFRKDGTLLSIPRDIKIEILEKLAENIYSYKAYPGNEEIESVAAALIEKHPCLKEPSSTSGWYGWKISLKFKMGNYRQKLRDAGCQELKVNSERRGLGETRGKRNKVKKPRCCETNFLPDLPQGKDRESLEKEREQMAVEMMKRTPDITFVDAAMSSTYSLRRQEVVDDEPPVSQMKIRWPAIFTERQISKEFTRLVSKDLSKSFLEGLDGHLSKLIQLFRSKRYEDIPEITSILESLDKNTTNQRMRTAALLGLPWYMRETPSKFMKICEPSDREEDVIKGVVIGILVVVENVIEPLPEFYNDVALVIEEEVVMRHLSDIPNAFLNLMGLVYALNLDNPKELKFTFEVIQCLFIGVGSDSCTARVHSLKSKLLR
ncbi:sterile alpha motif domain-containing protein 3-like [Carassius carassius]|uniref:sterile alpha motif domain-containing protein 3-like n=1 Tax=Carassius carassius TaxID=217509 RepID=UPI0028685DD2|nr:sterile alpha motif domain-containing protein 3-like [Carassius carassius]